jgi:hypothetical protein
MRERVVGLRPLLCRSCIEACLDVWCVTCQWLFHVARRHCSIWLSVLRQPAFQSAAPKCHSPSPCELSVLRRPVLGWSLASQRTTNIPQSWLRPPDWRSWPYVQRSQASRPCHPMCHAIALSPGIIEFWPGGQASGKMSANQIKGAWLCTGQTFIAKARFACSPRPLLRAPA